MDITVIEAPLLPAEISEEQFELREDAKEEASDVAVEFWLYDALPVQVPTTAFKVPLSYVFVVEVIASVSTSRPSAS